MLVLLSENTYRFPKLTVPKIGLRMSKPESSPYMTMLVSCLVACRIIPVHKMENQVYQFRVSHAELLSHVLDVLGQNETGIDMVSMETCPLVLERFARVPHGPVTNTQHTTGPPKLSHFKTHPAQQQ